MLKRKRLSDSELEVLEILWNLDVPAGLGEILEIYNEAHENKWKLQTLSTILSRLVQKGAADMEIRGRRHFYYAKLSKEAYEKEQVNEIIDEFYLGSIKDFLTAFYSGKPITKKEKEEISKWLDGQ